MNPSNLKEVAVENSSAGNNIPILSGTHCSGQTTTMTTTTNFAASSPVSFGMVDDTSDNSTSPIITSIADSTSNEPMPSNDQQAMVKAIAETTAVMKRLQTDNNNNNNTPSSSTSAARAQSALTRDRDTSKVQSIMASARLRQEEFARLLEEHEQIVNEINRFETKIYSGSASQTPQPPATTATRTRDGAQ